jgi:hypothetical protein
MNIHNNACKLYLYISWLKYAYNMFMPVLIMLIWVMLQVPVNFGA